MVSEKMLFENVDDGRTDNWRRVPAYTTRADPEICGHLK